MSDSETAPNGHIFTGHPTSLPDRTIQDENETATSDDSDDSPNGQPAGSTHPTAADLVNRCQVLLSELEAFKDYLKSRRQDHQVEIAHFRNTVKSEFRTLERLSSTANTDANQHTVNSSNLPFLETVWNTVKNSRGLVAMQKRFYWAGKGKGGKTGGRGGKNKQESALVDIVTGDGLKWIKVSLLTNTRLLFDKAKQGWEDASSSEDSDQEDQKQEDDQDDGNDVPLVKMSKDLFRTAKEVRIRTRQPKIILILPKIREGETDAIDQILQNLRDMGAEIHTSSSAPPSTPLDAVMTQLLTDPFKSLTPTLNIDCTILLALVSDFSHCEVEAEPWFHRALKRQVEIEDQENLLPNLLYPALVGRDLVCTDAATKRMREIVETIGTPGEKIRTALFMGDISSPASSLREELTKHSRFPVPDTLRLPIITQTPDLNAPTLPPSATKIKHSLTPINQSVFLHGWANNHTTVTSNRTVVKQIENAMVKIAHNENEWPAIWLCPTARSLVGKEKGRRD